ncbi:MAG: hypothetical protein AAF611_16825 [Bacteroidota bacterium]
MSNNKRTEESKAKDQLESILGFGLSSISDYLSNEAIDFLFDKLFYSKSKEDKIIAELEIILMKLKRIEDDLKKNDKLTKANLSDVRAEIYSSTIMSEISSVFTLSEIQEEYYKTVIGNEKHYMRLIHRIIDEIPQKVDFVSMYVIKILDSIKIKLLTKGTEICEFHSILENEIKRFKEFYHKAEQLLISALYWVDPTNSRKSSHSKLLEAYTKNISEKYLRELITWEEKNISKKMKYLIENLKKKSVVLVDNAIYKATVPQNQYLGLNELAEKDKNLFNINSPDGINLTVASRGMILKMKTTNSGDGSFYFTLLPIKTHKNNWNPEGAIGAISSDSNNTYIQVGIGKKMENNNKWQLRYCYNEYFDSHDFTNYLTFYNLTTKQYIRYTELPSVVIFLKKKSEKNKKSGHTVEMTKYQKKLIETYNITMELYDENDSNFLWERIPL